jgi:3-oxoacyl-[acyl-carrier protein] reductase
LKRLNDKVAVVTGSSRGIGKSIALAFAREGANLVVNRITSEDKARDVVSEIRAFLVILLAMSPLRKKRRRIN